MKIFLLCLIALTNSCSICCAQTCNNWLHTTSNPAYASIGQINISGNKITVEATFNRTTAYTGGLLYAGDLVSKHNSPFDANYLLRPNSAEITTSAGYFRTPDICEIELNKTYHVAMVYDGTTLKFYRNGFLMSQVAANGNLFQNTWKTRIGLYEPQTFNTNFIGYINEIRIWNVAKTQVELQSYMNLSLPTPTTQPGLVAYYTFDNLLNKQGNSAFDGILGGSATINQTNPNCNLIADSCAKIITNNPCNTDFSYQQNTCNPLSVQFFNIGNAPVNPYWSFGDGKIAMGNATPTHLYNTPGNYIVKYSTQNNTCTDTITKTIAVNIIKADIIITSDTTICFKSSRQLNTIPALSFCWSPTTFLSNPNSANPITSSPYPITYFFTAEMPGNNLIANGDFSLGNTGITSQYIFANPNITEGQYFIGVNPKAWNVGLSTCPDHTTGVGNMMLVNGAPIPDLNVWTQTVAVIPNTNYAFSTWIQALFPPNPAQLSFSINGGNLGGLITASLPTCTWKQFYTTWNSGNNTSATISIVNKNTIVQGNDFALDDITFSPVLIERDSVKITINSPFVQTIADTSICARQSVQFNSIGASSYTWSPSTGLNNSGIANPVATPTATTQYIVTGTNALGCQASDTVNIFINPPPVITKSADSTICHNLPIQLLAGGGKSYSWLPSATLNNSAIANPIAAPIGNTIYFVTVTGINNCSKTDSIKVALYPLPIFTISPNKATCPAKTVSLLANGGTSFLWAPAAFLNNPNLPNPIGNPTATTTFTVKIIDNTCYDSTTLATTVTVSPAPTVSAIKLNDIDCVLPNAQLIANGANSYVWLPATGLSNSNIFNPVASIKVPQQYLVKGTDTLTSCTGTDTITVFIKAPFDPVFFIPNAFSPNGDGRNDCFRVKHFGTVKSIDLSIYSRTGILIFHTLNVSDCWDGTYKGNPADPGNYVYYIKTFNDCSENVRKGNVILIR